MVPLSPVTILGGEGREGRGVGGREGKERGEERRGEGRAGQGRGGGEGKRGEGRGGEGRRCVIASEASFLVCSTARIFIIYFRPTVVP